MRCASALLLGLLSISAAHGQPTAPFTLDSTTRALWHFDEESGSILHDAAWGLNGTVVGATIVPGRFGMARYFDGNGDYVTIPSNPAFDFGDTSFTVEIWFRTRHRQRMLSGWGLAPRPGFLLGMNLGHVVAQVGNRGDSHWPDTLLTIQSDLAYNDNAWHYAKFVRDRTVRKFFLYVDGAQAAVPIDDPITFPISSDRPLTIGRWETDPYPAYIMGTIDEIRISSALKFRGPLLLAVQPQQLLFGKVPLGSSDSLRLTIMNTGNRDTLRISSIAATNPRFTLPPLIPPIPPLSADTVMVIFAPTSAGSDSGAVVISSNDPQKPVLNVPVSGSGIQLTEAPIINQIVSLNSSQARIFWFRSSEDAPAAADRIVQYSLWRDLPPAQGGVGGSAAGTVLPSLTSTLGVIWEYVATVPAVAFNQYAASVSKRWDMPYNSFIVAAHSRNGNVYISDPESLLVYTPVAVERGENETLPSRVDLPQNYPNPFNPTTTIRYGLPERGYVNLAVFNTLGQRVVTLVEGEKEAGYYEELFDAAGLASGLYLCRLTVGRTAVTRKLLMIR